ncbi:MAG TPA: hypothetical protein EYG11_19260 [Candidatus Latescibacteria bacterium]|nr:hypothetical protein [Candidatus Latescibacterota bacterium]
MNWLLQMAIGIGIIILCAGLVSWGNIYFGQIKKSKKDRKEDDQLVLRLNDIDRRMTEVQDVMIVLSEKIDRMDERERI